MEYIVFSDIHMYKNYSRSYLREDGLTSWVYNQIDVINQIFDYAIDNGIGIIIFNGDLFEQKNHLPQDLYNLVWNFFREKSKMFHIIFNIGNHDYHNINSTSLQPFSDIIEVVTEPKFILKKQTNKSMYMVPHGRLTENIPDTDILFIHEDIYGLKYAEGYKSKSLIDKSLFDRFPMVINGHIHIPQLIEPNILTVGSCMKHEFGEVGNRFFYHFNEDTLIKEIKVNCPDFIDIKGMSNRIKNEIIKDTYNYYRIDISPEELSDDIFKRFNVVPNIIKQNKIRPNRLEKTKTIDDEIMEYISLSETSLDKNKLLDIGKELLNADS